MHYAITALWTAAAYKVPLTIVVASNAEYGVLKQFGKIEHTNGVPGLDLPGLDIVATARSYGVRAHEAKSTGDVADLFTQALKVNSTGTAQACEFSSRCTKGTSRASAIKRIARRPRPTVCGPVADSHQRPLLAVDSTGQRNTC